MNEMTFESLVGISASDEIMQLHKTVNTAHKDQVLMVLGAALEHGAITSEFNELTELWPALMYKIAKSHSVSIGQLRVYAIENKLTVGMVRAGIEYAT